MSTIGLDLGTSRVKAIRFDDAGQAVDAQAETTLVLRPAGGGSEQDMADVWSAAARVVRTVAERSPDVVEVLALTAQGDGCWLVDRRGEPVRPAILWNDGRGAPVIDRWDDEGVLDRTFRINGCFGAPGLAHAQIHWLAEHEPDTLARAARVLSCGSWIYLQLTGRQVLEVSDAANPFLDARTRRYDDALLDAFDLGRWRSLLPETVSGPDRLAPLTAGAATAVGLPSGTPVALAPYDVPATAIGTGTIGVGQAFAVLGTTLCVGVVSDDPMLERAPNGMTLPGTAPDRWLIAYATMNGTEVLDWTARLLGLAGAVPLLELAATATPGRQPLMLPYLSPAGERSPFRSSTIRGSLHCLTLQHTQADIARAAVDALTLSVRDCLDSAGSVGQLALSGGGAGSELWCQAISDATNATVTAPDTSEVGARGAVLSAVVDLGMADSLQDAVGRTVGAGRVFEPHPAEANRLAETFLRFRSTRG